MKSISTANGIDASAGARPDGQHADAWQRATASLDQIARLRDDWDGDGALAPAAELVADVYPILKQLQNQAWPAPTRVAAGPNGTILLEWQHRGHYLEIDITAPGRTEWMIVRCGIPAVHGESIAELVSNVNDSFFQ